MSSGCPIVGTVFCNILVPIDAISYVYSVSTHSRARAGSRLGSTLPWWLGAKPGQSQSHWDSDLALPKPEPEPEKKGRLWLDPASGQSNQGEGSVFLEQSKGHANQRWFLCKDLHLAASKAVQDGSTYHIINAQSQTAIEVEESEVVCFTVDKGKSKQKFLAVKTATGWAFQNVETKRFLGLPTRVVPIERTQNSNPIQIQASDYTPFQWWKFEPVDATQAQGQERLNSASQPGEPET
ncbi:hypothetical protein BKA70DRAFT_1224892 [Coprinopsis sp. MPI-PUGE-AT-0042]|nr:hypothetical protein BKA70DRAFT_1224892 [Coprinopsis sp. MPI-PUGE-AT-0042]